MCPSEIGQDAAGVAVYYLGLCHALAKLFNYGWISTPDRWQSKMLILSTMRVRRWIRAFSIAAYPV